MRGWNMAVGLHSSRTQTTRERLGEKGKKEWGKKRASLCLLRYNKETAPEGLAGGKSSTSNADGFQYTTSPQLLQDVLRDQVAGLAGRVGLDAADVVRLALVERCHEPLQLLAELRAHAVQLEGALAPALGQRARIHRFLLEQRPVSHRQAP